MVLGATDNATVLVLRESESLIGQSVLADIAKLYIGNSLLARLDEALRKRSSTAYTDFSAGN